MVKVLFVCAGNICRSPMAEALFQDMVNKAGLGKQILVDSAGTDNWHLGEKAHPRTLKVLNQHNISYDGRARQFVRADLDEFDYVLAMDRENLAHIQRQFYQNKAKVNLFLSYARQAGAVDVDEVPDPIFNTDDAFLHVYDLARKGCAALLDYLRDRHDL